MLRDGGTERRGSADATQSRRLYSETLRAVCIAREQGGSDGAADASELGCDSRSSERGALRGAASCVIDGHDPIESPSPP
jgi:hypothetical protein